MKNSYDLCEYCLYIAMSVDLSVTQSRFIFIKGNLIILASIKAKKEKILVHVLSLCMSEILYELLLYYRDCTGKLFYTL